MNPVEARGLVKRFGDAEVLKGVDLEVARGEVVAVIGPSGSGKSTLLRCIAGLEGVDGGDLRVAGVVAGGKPPLATALKGRVGFVFQHFNLFPHLTALENVIEGPLAVRRAPKAEAREKGMALLAKVGLAARAHAYPRELSGGEQQRCAIARALAMEPELILFDEPTSALDPELVGEVMAVIAELAAEGRTLVVVTHQMEFAANIADRTVVMDAGGIVESGPSKALFAAPQAERTRRFLSKFGQA